MQLLWRSRAVSGFQKSSLGFPSNHTDCQLLADATSHTKHGVFHKHLTTFSYFLKQGVKRIHAVSISIIYSDLIEDIRLGSSFPFRSEKSTTRGVTGPFAQTTTEGHLHAGARKASNLTPTPWQ